MKKLIPYYNYNKDVESFCDLIIDAKNYSIDFHIKNCSEINFKSSKLKQLWASTCFEAFEFDTNSNSYVEWNFNKTLHYNFYYFKNYRNKGFHIKSLFIKPLKTKAFLKDETFNFNIALPRFFKTSIVQTNIVIKNEKGKIDYYALNHASLKPDFHKIIPAS